MFNKILIANRGEIAIRQDIIALCKKKLGSVKAPKPVGVWEALPRSPEGKVLKKEIRKRFWQHQERMV